MLDYMPVTKEQLMEVLNGIRDGDVFKLESIKVEDTPNKLSIGEHGFLCAEVTEKRTIVFSIESVVTR